MILFYSGSLNLRKKLDKDVKHAYISYRNQKARCYNKKVKSYKDYGARGIKIKYSARELVGWYLFNIKNFYGENPTIGRIDHDKDYSLDNIRIESKSENSKEAMQRTSHRFSQKVLIINRITNEIIDECSSLKQASLKYGNSFSCVHRIANNLIKNPRTKYIYRKV